MNEFIEKEINKVLGDFLIDNKKGLLLNKYEIEDLVGFAERVTNYW